MWAHKISSFYFLLYERYNKMKIFCTNVYFLNWFTLYSQFCYEMFLRRLLCTSSLHETIFKTIHFTIKLGSYTYFSKKYYVLIDFTVLYVTKPNAIKENLKRGQRRCFPKMQWAMLLNFESYYIFLTSRSKKIRFKMICIWISIALRDRNKKTLPDRN